jgi:predicted nucleotidyltransferase
MNSSLLEKLQTVCNILNQHSVEYLIIGGASVALHGHYRISKKSSGKEAEVDDLDFWYNPTYDNYFRLLNALEKLGENVSSFKKEQSPDPYKSFFRLERPQFTLDFLPSVPGLEKFREVFNAKEITQLGNVEMPFIGYEHLIINKQALGRLKDQEDIRQLKSKKQDENSPQQRPRRRPR